MFLNVAFFLLFLKFQVEWLVVVGDHVLQHKQHKMCLLDASLHKLAPIIRKVLYHEVNIFTRHSETSNILRTDHVKHALVEQLVWNSV